MEPPSVRVARLAESLEIMRAMWRGSATFGGDHYQVTEAVGTPAPVTPGGPPLVIGGGSRRILTLAGQYADTVSIVPNLAAGHIGLEVAAESVVEKYTDRVRWAKDAAGERAGDLEFQCWTATVQVVPNAAEVVESMAPLFNLTPDQLRAAPVALIGTAGEIAETLQHAAGGARIQQHRRARGGDGRAGAGDRRTCRDLSPPPASGSSAGRSIPPTSATWRRPGPPSSGCGLHRLLLVVANDPWQKSGQRQISAAEDRYALTEALAQEIPGAEASRLEIDRGGPSYSVDTAEALLAAGGRPVELFLVVGADLVPELGSWHRPDGSATPGDPGRRLPPRRRRPCPGAGLAGRARRRPAGRHLELGGPGPAGFGQPRRRAGARRRDPLHSPPRYVRCRGR